MNDAAFITGSVCYGTADAVVGHRSDIDLAVLVSKPEADCLRTAAPIRKGSVFQDDSPEKGRCGYSLTWSTNGPHDRSLNLLVFWHPEKFYAWKAATSALKERAPVDRETAVKVIDMYLNDSLAAMAYECEESCEHGRNQNPNQDGVCVVRRAPPGA